MAYLNLVSPPQDVEVLGATSNWPNLGWVLHLRSLPPVDSIMEGLLLIRFHQYMKVVPKWAHKKWQMLFIFINSYLDYIVPSNLFLAKRVHIKLILLVISSCIKRALYYVRHMTRERLSCNCGNPGETCKNVVKLLGAYWRLVLSRQSQYQH